MDSRYFFSPTKSQRPWGELRVTSTEVLFPPGFDFVFMAEDLGADSSEFGGAQSRIDGEFDVGRQPKLGLTARRVNMDGHSGLVPRKEEETEVAVLEDRRTLAADAERTRQLGSGQKH